MTKHLKNRSQLTLQSTEDCTPAEMLLNIKFQLCNDKKNRYLKVHVYNWNQLEFGQRRMSIHFKKLHIGKSRQVQSSTKAMVGELIYEVTYQTSDRPERP